MKKFRNVLIKLVIVVLSMFLVSCGSKTETVADTDVENNNESKTLKVYNWGEYIDPEVITEFENKYGVSVIYDQFETNEEMYPIVEMGSVKYDVICPSEYMIQKMIKNNLLLELDFSKLPLAKNNTDKKYFNMLKQIGGDKYAVPYMAGSVGIIYNKTLLDEKGLPYPTKYADLFNPIYKGEILMQNSVRDAMMVSLKKNGYSLNSVNRNELEIATNELIEQKPLVQAYVIDQVRDKMVNGEAMLAVIYSGELLYITHESEGSGYEYEYVLPEEGTNIWVDGWVIPKSAENVDNAYKWIDFMCDKEIAKMNAEYITYESPNVPAREIIDDDCKIDNAMVKDFSKNYNEVFEYLGEEVDEMYNEFWKQVKGS